MKFQTLIAAALLLLAVDTAAALQREAFVTVPQGAVVMPASTPGDGALADTSGAIVYQNGELVVDIRGTAGAGILRSVLALFYHDRCSAPSREPSAVPAAATKAQPQLTAMPSGVQGADAPLTEPLSLGLLGAGIALLGWTRRQGNWFDNWVKKQVFPWPALCWLD